MGETEAESISSKSHRKNLGNEATAEEAVDTWPDRNGSLWAVVGMAPPKRLPHHQDAQPRGISHLCIFTKSPPSFVVLQLAQATSPQHFELLKSYSPWSLQPSILLVYKPQNGGQAGPSRPHNPNLGKTHKSLLPVFPTAPLEGSHLSSQSNHTNPARSGHL